MFVKKSRIFCVLLSLAFLSLTAFGQKPEISAEKKKIIAEIITVVKADKNIEQVMSAMTKQMDEAYPLIVQSMLDTRDDLTTAQTAKLKKEMIAKHSEFSQRFQDKITQTINFQDFIQASFYPLYDKFFTEDELRDLLAFYKTPTGQKLNESLPQFSAEAVKLSQEYLLPKIQQIVIELVREDTEKSLSTAPAKRKN